MSFLTCVVHIFMSLGYAIQYGGVEDRSITPSKLDSNRAYQAKDFILSKYGLAPYTNEDIEAIDYWTFLNSSTSSFESQFLASSTSVRIANANSWPPTLWLSGNSGPDDKDGGSIISFTQIYSTTGWSSRFLGSMSVRKYAAGFADRRGYFAFQVRDLPSPGPQYRDAMFIMHNGNVGISEFDPPTRLSVNGSAQFGSGATKSTFSSTGNLILDPLAAFYGDGSGITDLVASNLSSGLVPNERIDGSSIAKIGSSPSFQVVTASTFNATGTAYQFNGIDFFRSSGLALSGDEYIQFFSNMNAPSWAEGKIFWDKNAKTLALYGDESDTSLQIGQENWVKARNATGSIILDGTPVYICGATGQMPKICKAKADAEATSKVIGLATHDIENNTNGYITTQGQLHNLNTSAWNEGDFLYLSSTTAGALVNSAPSGGWKAPVGTVLYSHVNSGVVQAYPSIYIESPVGDGDWVISGSNMYSGVSGNVGVGTTNPTRKLHVQGAGVSLISTTDWVSQVGTGYAIDFWGTAGTTHIMRMLGDSGNVGLSDLSADALLEVSASGGASELFMLSSNDANDGDRFIVKNNGNVGVGTTNPTVKLQVGVGNPGVTSSIATVNTVDTNVDALLLSNWDGAATTYGPRLQFDNSGLGVWFIGGSDGSNNFDIAQTWGTPRIRINSSGNVGVGTSSPGATLDVNGSSQFGSGVSKSTFSSSGSLSLADGATISSAGSDVIISRRYTVQTCSYNTTISTTTYPVADIASFDCNSGCAADPWNDLVASAGTWRVNCATGFDAAIINFYHKSIATRNY